MKKTTIALLTAAAMGTSGAVMAANHGPEFSGRLDIRYSNESGDGNNGTLNGGSSQFEVSGSGEAIQGITTSYYLRLNVLDLSDSEEMAFDYRVLRASGDFGTVSAGVDDDLVYKFAGAHTDVFRTLDIPSSAYYSDDYEFGEINSLQYSFGIEGVTFAAYADTSADDGIERSQFAVGYSAGPADFGLIYSDRDDAGDESQLVFGTRIDLDLVSLRGHVSDDESGNNPYAVAAVVPLTDMLTFTAGYGDDDVDESSAAFMLMANLGGGLDVHIDYRNGGSGVEDAIGAGARLSF